LGANFEVVHHTELIADLLKEGVISTTENINSVITYHDPCYLGRYNGVYEAPRNILHAISDTKLKEMERSRSNSFCCGGGGIHMWFEQQIGTKINEIRTEEVLKTNANTVITSCPYCLQMLEEAIQRKELQDTLKVNDIAELVQQSINKTT